MSITEARIGIKEILSVYQVKRRPCFRMLIKNPGMGQAPVTVFIPDPDEQLVYPFCKLGNIRLETEIPDKGVSRKRDRHR